MIRILSKEEIYPLRQRVLRPNQPLSSCYYPGDETALHLGYEEEGILLSIVTALPESHAYYPDAWRIRGMATELGAQGKGYGSLVLQSLLEWGKKEKVSFWCNARERAIPFYERHGFVATGELFEIEGIGPHKVMGWQA